MQVIWGKDIYIPLFYMLTINIKTNIIGHFIIYKEGIFQFQRLV